MATFSGAVLAALLLCVSLSGPSAGAQTSDLTGDIPADGGVSLVQWTGGSTEALQNAAAVEGCNLISAWLTIEDRFTGYVHGAPEFVNADWSAQVGTELNAGDVLIVCARPNGQVADGLESCDPREAFDIDWPPGTGYSEPAAALDALQAGAVSFLTLPAGTFVEVDTNQATAQTTTQTTATWNLVTAAGVIVGEFNLEHIGAEWFVVGGHFCA